MKMKKLIIRLIISFVFWVLGIVFSDNEILRLSFFVLAYLISGYDILVGAIRNIVTGNLLDEFFLMSVASVGAFILGEYVEAVAVMIFFQVGEVFQGIAVEKSKKAIMDTMDLHVTKCWLENGEEIDPEDVKVGQKILVKPGEMVPLDGILINSGTVNTSSLTGEPLDSDVNAGDMVLSGSINTTTPLIIEVVKEYYDSTAMKILDMVENATMKKAKSEKFITKFARVYTPIVVGFAVVLAFLPPLIMGFNEHFNIWLYRALSFLVVSCPCALVISVPLSYFAGIGACAKNKIIVKGGSYLEDLANISNIILDKTGTLTKAEFNVVSVIGDKEEILKIARGLEDKSNHPLALAINKYTDKKYEFEVKETPGYGVIGYKDNIRYICGSKKLLNKYGIEEISIPNISSVLYIAENEKCIGAVLLQDVIKEEAKKTINDLTTSNINVTVLSGDTLGSVEKVCNNLNIKNYYSSLLPTDKVEKIKDIIEHTSGKTMFVGDGINDAPVLAISDIGVSMGQVGSDSAVEASDVVILNDNLKALPKMLKIAKKTRNIVIQNIVFAIGIKVLVLILSAFGIVGMDWAIFADVGVCVIAIINAMRALKS